MRKKMSKHIDAEIGLAYLEGRLDAAQKVKLEQHIGQCDQCKQQLTEYQVVHSALASAAHEFEAPEPRPTSWYTVKRAKETQETQSFTGWQFAVVGAMAVVLFLWWNSSTLFAPPMVEPVAEIDLLATLQANDNLSVESPPAEKTPIVDLAPADSTLTSGVEPTPVATETSIPSTSSASESDDPNLQITDTIEGFVPNHIQFAAEAPVGYAIIQEDDGFKLVRIDSVNNEIDPIITLENTLDFSKRLTNTIHTSPSGKQVVIEVQIYTLELFDSEGRSFGRQENASILDWRPGGGPIIAQETADRQTQLVYWEPDYQKFPRVFVRPSKFTFLSGRWDRQAEQFVYFAHDPSVGANYLYLWHPQTGAPTLLHSVSDSEPIISDLSWLPDGSGFYFMQRDEIWHYVLDTNQAYAIDTPTP